MGREKKYIQAVLAAAVMVALIGTVSVRAEDTGAYASVKAVFGYTVINGMRAKGDAYNSSGGVNYSASIGSGSGEDAVFGGSAALGYDFFRKFCVPVRAEAEYSIFTRASDSNSGLNANGISLSAKEKLKVNAQTMFVNAYYDFHNQSRFTPYLGAGAGLAFVRSKGCIDIKGTTDGWPGSSTGGHTKTNFAYNATAGVSYALTKSIDLDLAYRFADLGKARSGAGDIDCYGGSYNNQAKHIYMHQVQLGVRFSF